MPDVDLLFLTYNRLEFTRFSLEMLLSNTNWGYVNRLIVYDDGSIDGTWDYILDRLRSVDIVVESRRRDRIGGPVRIMKHYLEQDPSEPAQFLAKIDNDTVVPPHWLDLCLSLMRNDPDLDLLGIEPPLSRKRPAGNAGKPLINPRELEPGPLRWVKAGSVGGIGLFRRGAFEYRPKLRPYGFNGVGGFTDWQLSNPDLNIGWIAPPLKVFLLDRMPTEPWRSLSKRYIDAGWQRLWGNYTMADQELWSWCPEVNAGNAVTAINAQSQVAMQT
jgi:glycosyltransferase involved in cell wall biosynthesis